MARADGAALSLVLWAPTFTLFLLQSLGSCSAFYYREYGVVKPDDPYLLVGEDLVLFCNLTKLELLEDSSYLYFTRNSVKIPSHYVDILTTRSVRLRYPVRRPEDEGHFVCWLRQERGNPRTIGSQHVKAEYPLAPVTEVNCTVYNWENMTCQWELGRAYQHPEYIHVSLVWTISGVQKDCPQGHMTNTSCTWVRGGMDSFLPGHRYIMSVEVSNTKRGINTRSQTFHVRTDTIVKPSPVQNLHRHRSNSTCLWLMWNHTDVLHDKVAYVQYLSQWNSSHWHKLETIFFKQSPGQANICQLTPFTEYTVRVAVKPLPRGGHHLDGYRSEWKYIEKVRTDPAVPEVSPELCAGCFTDVFCDRPRCRNVIVYWKHIPWAQRRSVIHSYQLLYTSLPADSTLSGNATTLYPNTSHLLPLVNDSDYNVRLFAVTSDNKLSLNHSSLFLSSLSHKPDGPESLIVETDFTGDGRWTGQFDLRWSPGGQSTASFLVAWCRGSRLTLLCHREDQNQVQWQEVSSSSSQFRIIVSSQEQDHSQQPSHYIVGVARQVRLDDGQLVSSGLTWARCFYLKDTAPSAIPEDVDFTKVFRAGTLRLTWTYRACDVMATDVYVTRFVIYYCVITDTANNRCKGNEFNTTVRREARSVLLEDLEQGAYYRVSMAADSRWGSGQRSQPVYSRVLAAQQQEEPRDFTVIGVILAVVIVIILILIGLCKLRSRFHKGQEKFIASFGDLPSLPPDSAVKSFKDRPLPQVPQGCVAGTTVVYTAGSTTASATTANGTADKRLRGGKHKSITSETSLLGHEDGPQTEEDSRRRHKSANGSVSEKSRLLTEDGVVSAQETSCTTPVSCKYDSDSGAESRFSGDDHDYASVEGGSGSAAEEGEGGVGGREAGESLAGGGGGDGGDSGVTRGDHPPHHRPAPTHAPPHPPSSGYTQATFVGGQADGLSTFRPQGVNKAMGQVPPHPAQLVVALEPVQSARTLPSLAHQRATPASSLAYLGSEDCTLPRRPVGGKLRHHVQGTPVTTSVDPYASTNVASFSPQPPSAPHPYGGEEGLTAPSEPQVGRAMLARGYSPHPALSAAPAVRQVPPAAEDRSASGGRARKSEAGREDSEPIYSPPWESTGLLPYAVDNRPLSEYMLKLPHNFFDSSLHVNEGPTTEL